MTSVNINISFQFKVYFGIFKNSFLPAYACFETSQERMNESIGYEVFPKDEFISLVIISVFIIILAVPVNILVLFGYVSSRSSRARPSTILLISLIFAQLLISVVLIPSQLLEVIRPDLVANGGVLCVFVGTTFYSLYITMTETLACISVDRFLAVKSMLRYSTIITRKRVVAAVVFTWIHAALFLTVIGPLVLQMEYNDRVGACGVVYDDRTVLMILMLAIYGLMPFGIIIVSNCKMAKHLWRHNRRIVQRPEGQSIDEKRNRARQGNFYDMAYNIG